MGVIKSSQCFPKISSQVHINSYSKTYYKKKFSPYLKSGRIRIDEHLMSGPHLLHPVLFCTNLDFVDDKEINSQWHWSHLEFCQLLLVFVDDGRFSCTSWNLELCRTSCDACKFSWIKSKGIKSRIDA